MQISYCGFILNTENYPACVAFYRDVLGLVVLFDKDTAEEQLTCFDLGGAYLMVEPGGRASALRKEVAICPVKLRLNTPDIDAAIAHLRARGVAVEARDHPWGRTAEFADPDGNRCALRSETGFGA